MSTTYPGTKQTFTDPAGTSTLAGVDHAGLHTDVNDTLEALQDTVGTTAGTNVLKDFAAGDFPVRIDSGNTIQTALIGTLNNSTLATATINNSTLGTPTVTLGSDAQGDVYYRSSAGTVTRLGIGTSGQYLTTNGTTPSWGNVTTSGGKSPLFENMLINGNMDIWQRLDNAGTFTAATRVANNDDTYMMDRWVLISDGNDVVDITRSTDKPDKSTYSAKFDVQTSAQFGIVQIIENKDAAKIDNGTVSLSFAAKTDTTEITTVRAAVLTWSSTADSVTSDVVATWGATPTWATNWTAENTPGDITIDSTWTTYSVENIAIDSGTVNNVAVVIWTPNAESIGDTLYLSQVMLNEGASAATYYPNSWDAEYKKCLRYYEQSWTYGAAQVNSQMTHVSNTNGYLWIEPSERKRVGLSLSNTSFYNGTVVNVVRNTNTAGTVAVGTAVAINGSDRFLGIYDLSEFTANTAYDYNWIINTEL